MKNETKRDGEVNHEDLLCPITHEIYRDPVRATDGFVYERDAITRWILQKGTSPFTRQPLKIDELKPDDKLRHLARRRRHSTVSYDAHDNTVSLPPLRRVPRPVPQIAPIITHGRTYRTRVISKKLIFRIVLIIIAISITVGPILGMALGM
ncbi:unnamed protein product [Rotaria sp. Silwood1]|nr:unnamed protein product [Rotaria sp. Silwood1]CAF4865001.1 unnamed protein product [Rotaria sp. Silwood1]CAF4884420.1 unnamed protein product [Rotaria sp. Silwood1]